tara:strand:- start:185 stop:913 length:729 start_codon:yes stop_codon:yes gene_type:complete
MAIDKITAPAITDDSVTLAKMAPGTDGNIISYDASGNPVAVATGSAGQVLTSAGAGAPPTFAAAGGGAMDLLHTATGSNVSSIDINGYFTSDYDHYKLVYAVYAATSNTDTIVRIMQGGSVITASNYRYAGMAWYYDGSTAQVSNAQGFGSSYWGISSMDNTADSQSPTTGEMLLSNPLSTSQNTTFTTTSVGYNSPTPPSAIRVWTYAGTYVSTTATSGISFLYDGGNVNGTIRLYGVKNS